MLWVNILLTFLLARALLLFRQDSVITELSTKMNELPA